MASSFSAETSLYSIFEVIPSEHEFDSALVDVLAYPAAPSLAVMDSLIPSKPIDSSRLRKAGPYDKQGFSPFARSVSALLQIVADDRQLGRQHSWAVWHILALGIYATDRIYVPGVVNPVFGPVIDDPAVRAIEQKAKQTATYLLSICSSDLPQGWHSSVTNDLKRNPNIEAPLGDDLKAVIFYYFASSINRNKVGESRIFRLALEALLRGALIEDVDAWVSLAQVVQDKGE